MISSCNYIYSFFFREFIICIAATCILQIYTVLNYHNVHSQFETLHMIYYAENRTKSKIELQIAYEHFIRSKTLHGYR